LAALPMIGRKIARLANHHQPAHRHSLSLYHGTRAPHATNGSPRGIDRPSRTFVAHPANHLPQEGKTLVPAQAVLLLPDDCPPDGTTKWDRHRKAAHVEA